MSERVKFGLLLLLLIFSLLLAWHVNAGFKDVLVGR